MLFKEVVGNQETKKALIQQVESGRVSHAQLFLGPEGSGKLAMAIAYSQYLLCDAPTSTDACDECPNCLKMKSLTHPDLHFAFPVVANKTAKIGSSIDRIKEWNSLILKNTYFGLNQWQEELDEMGEKCCDRCRREPINSQKAFAQIVQRKV
jgi:DNA polymerase-3 subunit delta'